jgi:hypothetical protein
LHYKDAMRTKQTHTLQRDYEQEIEHLQAQVVIARALPLPGLAQLLDGQAISNYYYLC